MLRKNRSPASRTGLDRARRFTPAACEPPRNEETGSPLIHFENVGFALRHGTEILRDMTFDIPKGSFQFLTGPSGAGKTTLLACF